VPRYVSELELGIITAVVLRTEEIARRLERKVDALMTLVSVDDSVLAAIGTSLSSIDDEVTALVNNPNLNIQAGDVSGIQSTIADLNSKLAAPTTPVTPPDGGDGTTPTDGGDGSTPTS
jgi:hypothetical protein